MASEAQSQSVLKIIKNAQKRQDNSYTFTLAPQIVEQLRKSPAVTYVTDPIDNTFVRYPTVLAQQIMSNPTLLTSVQHFFKDNSASTFTFTTPPESSTNKNPEFIYSLSRYDIVSVLESLCMQDEATTEQQSILQSFKDLTSADKLLKDFSDQTYTVNIDGANLTFSCKDLISTLTLYAHDLKDISPEKASSLDTRQHFYALTRFIKDENIFKNYFLGRQVENAFEQIASSKQVDITAFNKIVETKNDYLEQTNLSPELVAEVYRGMPDDLSKLEQAQFVYIKLCKILTYDQTYFACGQKGPLAQAHKSISYIPNITPQNNGAVCYEFGAIYSKFLSDLNINHELVFRNTMQLADPYGHKHCYVSFRADEYLVSADPTRSLARSDMASVKFGMMPKNMHLKNTNELTKNSFNSSLFKVYNLVQSLYEDSSQQDSSFTSALESYEGETNPFTALNTTDKFNLILDLLGQCNEAPMEVMSYAYFLSDAILNSKDLEHFNISEIRHTPVIDDCLQEQVAELGLILSMENSHLNPNAENFCASEDNLSNSEICNSKGYTRAYYSPSTGLKPLNDLQMHDMFTTGEFSYIRPSSFSIPGGPDATMQYVLNTEQ